jgi:hypothetical protein
VKLDEFPRPGDVLIAVNGSQWRVLIRKWEGGAERARLSLDLVRAGSSEDPAMVAPTPHDREELPPWQEKRSSPSSGT